MFGTDQRDDFEGWKAALNRTQHHFVSWNADRLGIDRDESYRRYYRSYCALPGGLAGPGFRRLGDQMHELLSVFFGDGEAEVFQSYRHHAPMHFLRMLSYPEPRIGNDLPLFRALARREKVRILDFGCGLAQVSRTFADKLMQTGVTVDLVLADIPTQRKDFLLWLGRQTGIATRFLDCTAEAPIPKLPASDLIVCTEVFEHLHDPVPYLAAFEAALPDGGVLLTDVSDHHDEMFHVSPDLSALRTRLAGDGWQEAHKDKLFVRRIAA